MSEDYFDLAHINFNRVILYGRRKDGSEVDRDLTMLERERVGRLAAKHDAAMQDLLRELAGELEITRAPA